VERKRGCIARAHEGSRSRSANHSLARDGRANTAMLSSGVLSPESVTRFGSRKHVPGCTHRRAVNELDPPEIRRIEFPILPPSGRMGHASKSRDSGASPQGHKQFEIQHLPQERWSDSSRAPFALISPLCPNEGSPQWFPRYSVWVPHAAVGQVASLATRKVAPRIARRCTPLIGFCSRNRADLRRFSG